jgi:hypothetical protein
MSGKGAAFLTAARAHQRLWALASGIPEEHLDPAHGPQTWVLQPEHLASNFFDSQWAAYIAGAEHHWARALTSSQCFAVNLFAPLSRDASLARSFLAAFLPDRAIHPADCVSVAFEQTPPGMPGWLGERRQPTQVDVFFTVTRDGRPFGYVLVEVKFTEISFGGCRGWNDDASRSPRSNPDRSRCLDLKRILAAPERHCWMAERERRTYWDIMRANGGSFSFRGLPASAPCPFRHGLYQVMRNRVLADCLRIKTAVCA